MWLQPKRNWELKYDSDGNYLGDMFEALDYNRIVNNLKHLHQISSSMFPPFPILLMDMKQIGDYLYADDMNAIEENLLRINENTVNIYCEERSFYEVNGATMTYQDLNRIEGTIFAIHEALQNKRKSLHRFTWRFGEMGGL